MKELKEGLKKLGVRGKVQVRSTGNLFYVYVNSDYFGIYSTDKQTFVD